jgi:hypothetical protein
MLEFFTKEKEVLDEVINYIHSNAVDEVCFLEDETYADALNNMTEYFTIGGRRFKIQITEV